MCLRQSLLAIRPCCLSVVFLFYGRKIFDRCLRFVKPAAALQSDIPEGFALRQFHCLALY